MKSDHARFQNEFFVMDLTQHTRHFPKAQRKHILRGMVRASEQEILAGNYAPSEVMESRTQLVFG